MRRTATALADPEQIRIMRAVTSMGSARATQLAAVTRLAESTVSRHLADLTAANLIEQPRSHYQPTDAGIRAVVAAADATPRLNFAEVERDFTRHYGHQAVALGEDGDTVAIVGHLGRLHAAGVARCVIRVDTGGDVSWITDVRHVHGEFVECWFAADDCGWSARYRDTPTAGSVPLTVVDVEVW